MSTVHTKHKHKHIHSKRKNPLLLCNDCVLCSFFFCTQFSSVSIRSENSYFTLNSRRLLSILQLKINELPDYRICGQSSSSSHCLCVCFFLSFRYRMKFYTFATIHTRHSGRGTFSVVFDYSLVVLVHMLYVELPFEFSSSTIWLYH